jgi:CubicO group peptidase (beta-lactamase class C family)
MDELHLRATILQVMIDGDVVVSAALGESISGVPATTDMRFRNGAVAISLISTLMLTLVDDGVLGLDDPIVTWLPDLPDADTATPRMLANMTAGYRDHVQNPEFVGLLMDDPFRSFDPQEILSYSFSQPRLFAPGANWEYSHSNYFVLGLVMEAATGQSVEQLMQDRVLDPLGLTGTVNNATGQMADPALHSFTSERRAWFDIEPGTRFYEESTYWNPSWTITQGAVQTTTIEDFAASMVAVAEGTLLSPESSAAQLDRRLLGFGEPLDGCFSCHTLDEQLNYGLGVVFRGPWIIQNPLFYGGSGVSAYLPERKVSIAVANTYGEAAFDEEGTYSNSSVPLFEAIAAALAPDLATPVP